MQRRLSPLVFAWCLAGCAALPEVDSKEPLDERIVVHRGDEAELSMELRADSARLEVGSGACEYVEIRAKYETEGIEPEVAYSEVSDTRAHILATEKRRAEGKHYGSWTVCVDPDTPLRLQSVARGGTFRLSELQIEELVVDGRGGHVELEMLDVKHSMRIRLTNDGGTIGLKLPTDSAFEMQLARAEQVKYMEVDGLQARADGRYVGARPSGEGVAMVQLEVEGTPRGVRVREKNFRGKWR